MEEAWNHFEQFLVAACSQVGTEYFQLPVADADAVYRERVYCYELYHQLRRLWEIFRSAWVEKSIKKDIRISKMVLMLEQSPTSLSTGPEEWIGI